MIDRPNSAQANLVLGTLSIERTDPDYFALEAMNQVLGGGEPLGFFSIYARIKAIPTALAAASPPPNIAARFGPTPRSDKM